MYDKRYQGKSRISLSKAFVFLMVIVSVAIAVFWQFHFTFPSDAEVAAFFAEYPLLGDTDKKAAKLDGFVSSLGNVGTIEQENRMIEAFRRLANLYLETQYPVILDVMKEKSEHALGEYANSFCRFYELIGDDLRFLDRLRNDKELRESLRMCAAIDWINPETKAVLDAEAEHR